MATLAPQRWTPVPPGSFLQSGASHQIQKEQFYPLLLLLVGDSLQK